MKKPIGLLAMMLVLIGCNGNSSEQGCVPEHEMVCWPEPGPGAEVRWIDSCGQAGEVVDPCLGTHVECREGTCQCLNHWEGEECTRCPDNWDKDRDCSVCRTNWVDEDNDCGTCPGNWDAEADCAVCRNHWSDLGDDCGTCPGNWDPDQDCDACQVGWTGDDCSQIALGCDDQVCTDPGSGLTWQKNATSTAYDWYWAGDYCEQLGLAGHGDWRLPTISELRTLVRGCTPVETGGACRVDSGCLDQSCHDSACTPAEECPSLEGPGELGCYWPIELGGDCDLSHWSSSERSDDDRRVWDLRFRDAYLSWSTKDYQQSVRCVR